MSSSLTAILCLLVKVLINNPNDSNSEDWYTWRNLSKCVKTNLNLCGYLIVATLSGSEFQCCIVLGKLAFL